ncbi:hypothetical protein VTH8203_03410 [Vibrio thalassae]|uniref:Class I SAM-dependent methyltransferase n=2 Tax=Vibrio thalassae TaxID=1243014 RepID=A0A240EM45_9VIBR|nr:hypothetical protein VTH8203_03410 [Vibrio thalassae]
MYFNKDLAATTKFKPRSLQSPSAWMGHIPFASWLVKQMSPKLYVELGTHSGNSYFSICQTIVESNKETVCYAVDTWQGDEHAGNYDESVYNYVSKHNKDHYSKFSYLLRTTFDEAANNFADKSIDLLHIDGLHTYEAVKHDFETWLPKLAPGAIILFHDTVVREREFGVWKLWGELTKQYPNNIEFVHSHGLGVLQIPFDDGSYSFDWLNSNSKEVQETLVDFFGGLGTSTIANYEKQILEAEREDLLEKISSQYADLNHLKSELESVYNSRSWKITRPMRAIK